MGTRIAVLGGTDFGKQVLDEFRELSTEAFCIANQEHAKINPLLQDEDVSAVVVGADGEDVAMRARYAIDAGKDVFMEDIFVLNCADAVDLVQRAIQAQRTLITRQCPVFDPAIEKVREMLEQGVLGRLKYIYAERVVVPMREKPRACGCGFGLEDIALILDLCEKEPFEVNCTGSITADGCANVTTTIFRFASGQGAHAFVSSLQPYPEHRLIIYGEAKTAILKGISIRDRLTLYDKPMQIGDRQAFFPKNIPSLVEVAGSDGAIRAQCKYFLECLENRRATGSTDLLKVLNTVEGCRKSLENRGRPITIAESITARPSQQESR